MIGGMYVRFVICNTLVKYYDMETDLTDLKGIRTSYRIVLKKISRKVLTPALFH